MNGQAAAASLPFPATCATHASPIHTFALPLSAPAPKSRSPSSSCCTTTQAVQQPSGWLQAPCRRFLHLPAPPMVCPLPSLASPSTPCHCAIPLAWLLATYAGGVHQAWSRFVNGKWQCMKCDERGRRPVSSNTRGARGSSERGEDAGYRGSKRDGDCTCLCYCLGQNQQARGKIGRGWGVPTKYLECGTGQGGW